MLAPAALAKLALFAPFVGACWSAQFTPTVSDTHCFDTMYEGAHVRDRHEVRQSGKVIYAGETIYSADGDDLVFTYVNSTGGVGHGSVTSNNGTIHFLGDMRGSPAAAPQPIDSEWRVRDSKHYEVRSLDPNQPGKTASPILFVRVR